MTSHITRCHWNQCSETMMHSSSSSSSLFRHHTISALPKCGNHHSADHMTYHPQLSTVTAIWAGFSFIPSAIGSYRHLETFDMSCGIKLLSYVTHLDLSHKNNAVAQSHDHINSLSPIKITQNWNSIFHKNVISPFEDLIQGFFHWNLGADVESRYRREDSGRWGKHNS